MQISTSDKTGKAKDWTSSNSKKNYLEQKAFLRKTGGAPSALVPPKNSRACWRCFLADIQQYPQMGLSCRQKVT